MPATQAGRTVFEYAALGLAIAALLSACSHNAARSADVVMTGGVIYTADEKRTIAEAIAFQGDTIIFVGSDKDARKLVTAASKLIDLGGRLALPGLHDVHLHPVSAMEVGTCSLTKTPMTLARLSSFVAACIERFAPPPGEWLYVDLWAYELGNQPGDGFSTIRQALDAAAPNNPVLLEGSDGHHFAANSSALATAKDADGRVVGLSARTLKTDFADLAHYVGVDATGEPNGRFTESYIYSRLDVEAVERAELAKRLGDPTKMMEVTLPRGITSFLDAAARPETLPVYDALLANNKFHARAKLALFFDPARFHADDGSFDAAALMSQAKSLREKYRSASLVQATYLKLFADGVLEGDPRATPPTPPNAAMLRDYLQPLFESNEEAVRVKGYVDPNGKACLQARAESHSDAAVGAAFVAANGFYPQQCVASAGALQHPEKTIRDFIRIADADGFTFNIHAIGDRAVRTALDAIEAAQSANNSTNRHIITHLQLVSPDDVERFGALGVYASFTFAWATIDPEYDFSVLPFIDRVNGSRGMYDPSSYYIQNAYPAASIKREGGVIIAGSDAPVDIRDPRPFVNIEGAVTRDIFGAGALNRNEALTIADAVDAYTINAAAALGQEDIAGSLEPGKKADLIVVDQDIFALAASGQASKISETVVLETWFAGEKVFSRSD